MSDFYSQTRERMMDTMQRSLRQIRQVLNYGVQEFGNLMGLTRQTINNLEMLKTKMSAVQYVAVCAVIDSCVQKKPEELLPILTRILEANASDEGKGVFDIIENGSFLKKWFLCFPNHPDILDFSRNGVLKMDEEGMENLSECYRVFLDDSVLMEEGFAGNMELMNAAMENCGNQYIVPMKVVESIQKGMEKEEGARQEAAKSAMNFLLDLQNRNLLQIRGEKSDITVISTLVSVFAKFKYSNRLLLITCDAGVARQVLLLNNADMGGFPILVLNYSQESGFRRWDAEDREEPVLRVDIAPEEPELPAAVQENTLKEEEPLPAAEEAAPEFPEEADCDEEISAPQEEEPEEQKEPDFQQVVSDTWGTLD